MFDQALRINPNCETTYLNRGLIYFYLKETLLKKQKKHNNPNEMEERAEPMDQGKNVSIKSIEWKHQTKMMIFLNNIICFE